MDETIIAGSSVGKRINIIHRNQSCTITYKGKKIPLISKITIGRDKNNDIILESRLISRFHAELQKIKGDYYIHDLNSSNGTFINDKIIPKDKYVKVSQDNIIKIGKTVLKITI